MTEFAAIERLRELATRSLSEATAAAENLRQVGDRGPELAYFLAELRARAGFAHQAIDLIDEARRGFVAVGDDRAAERCSIGMVTVLDDLGRHGEAIDVATEQITRLRSSGRVVQRGPTVIDNTDLLLRALSNRGWCLETTGRFAEAITDYEEASLLAIELDDADLAAKVEINRSNALDALGRTSEALAALERAWAMLTDAARTQPSDDGDLDDRQTLVKLVANVGVLNCRLGRYDDGLRAFAEAESLVEPNTEDAVSVMVETADALATLGAHAEAIARYVEALEVLESRPLSWLEGRAWLGLGRSRHREGDVDPALDALRRALSVFDASANVPGQLGALMEMAAVDHANGGVALAAGQLRRALAMAPAEHWPVQACIAHLQLAELEPDVDAERHIREALRLAESIGLAPLIMRVEERLGALLLRLGRAREAVRPVERAAHLAERLRGFLRHQALLQVFPIETGRCLSQLVTLRLALGDIEGAANAADRYRSRSLLDAGAAASSDDSTELRALETELHALYDRLLINTGDLKLEHRRQLEERARTLEDHLNRERFRLDSSGGEQRDVDVNPTIAGVAGVADVALLFHELGGHIGAFVGFADGGFTWHPNLSTSHEVSAELVAFHAEGRRALALASAGVNPAAGGRSRHLDRLGALLLSPLTPLLAPGDPPIRLTIVPCGPLHAVPFSGLGCAGAQLLDLAIVSIAPSLELAKRCQDRVSDDDRRVLVGVSSGGIPAAAGEVRALSEAHQNSLSLIDEEATVDSVARAIVGAGVVHLASHGVFRPNAPFESGVRLADGWLSARRVSTLDLAGSCVVLSACDTGQAIVSAGEEILGLQNAFVTAGARSVVLSLWPAHDQRTKELMVEFHRHLGEMGVAAALRHAQLTRRSQSPHPWWWAGFVVAGAGS